MNQIQIAKERRRMNHLNTMDIMKDTNAAKEQGLSYGKYKAGIGIDFEKSEYPVSTRAYMMPTNKDSNGAKKSMARIL